MPAPVQTIALLVCLITPVLAEVGATYYFDEQSKRYLTVTETAGEKVTVLIRAVDGSGGYFWRWSGEGLRKERQIVFSRILGEGEEPGSKFVADAGGSRVEIGYLPDQKAPQDEGLNGEYRRISEDKRLSMVKKDFKLFDDTLKLAIRNWRGPDGSSGEEWMRRWPVLRSRWTGKTYPSPDPATLEKQADYWIALTETTGQAIGWANQPWPEVAIPANGAGDYNDVFGGAITLRVRPSGAIGLNLGLQRGPEEADGAQRTLEIPVASLVKGQGGDWSAALSYANPEKPEEPPAEFRVRKSGRYLWVDTTNATAFPDHLWFDGVYRWAPIAVSE